MFFMPNQRDEFIQRLLIDGGLKEGMSVLDVGCGPGNLSFIAADIVGSDGSVTGIDIDAYLLDFATDRAAAKGYDNVEFKSCNVNFIDIEGTFDAIIGRRVLMYQEDAGKIIENLTKYLKDDGIMIFQESDEVCSNLNSSDLPVHSMVQDWIWSTVKKEGANSHTGTQLYSMLKNADLKIELTRCEAIIQTYETGTDLVHVTQLMENRMRKFNILPEHINYNDLENELRQEILDANHPYVRDLAFGVVARK